MTAKHSMGDRIISVVIAIAILFTMAPLTAFTAAAATVSGNRITDPSTMDSWKEFFPTTGEISTENAGGVWMDKSVFTDVSEFGGLISQKDPSSFIVALSAMAANMSITGTSSVPTDTMLILDVSGSMNDGDNDVAEELVEAANQSIGTLLSANKNNRVGVVLYSGSSGSSTNYTTAAMLLLPLGRYTTGSDGMYLTYTIEGWRDTTETIGIDSDVIYEGTINKPTSQSKEVVGATYIQRGIITAMNEFVDEDNKIGAADKRKPVVVLMSDGAPSLGSTNFTDPGYNQSNGFNLGSGSGTSAALGFVSQLTAAYAKAKIEEKYGTDALFYTLGLGLGANDTVALSVMDPGNANGSTAVDDFWNDIQRNWGGQITFEGYNHVDVGETVSLGNNRSVTKIDTILEQNYVDQYFAASTTNLVQVFKNIMSAIQLQSAYFPTLISESEDLSGYVSFVDRIGEYMSVTDIKGILIDNHLFSGADLASNFVTGGGNLGTWDNPTALGIEMVAAVRARLGLDSDDTARTLIALAYENGQLSYTNANNYSNYIGWYANAAGEYLGFYNEGTTVLPEATGNAATDPAFIIRSYGYLGAVDESHGVSESDMMYATVQVREKIATGEQLVTFAVPAALIPVVTYNVTLDSDRALSDLTVSGADNPIRLVYEVALNESINSFNVKEVVSAAYLAENTNADGTVNFYTNQWEHENKTGYGTVNTYSYFNPSRQNDKYYYLEDTPIYSDSNGTLYTGSAQPSAEGTFYRSYSVYKNNGSLRTETIYRPLSAAAKETALQNAAGNWYIPMGNVHVDFDDYTVHKTENKTGTLTEASIPFVDTHNHTVNDTGYEFYVGATLGNNGRFTVVPETGIKLTKTMANSVAAPDEAFTFNIFNTTNQNDNNAYPAWLIKADGTESDINIVFNGGHAMIDLNAGDVLYIGGMTAGNAFRISEVETVQYVATATGLSDSGTVTANANEIKAVAFINDDRGEGNLTVAKEVQHDFGVDYQIPADKVFTMEVTLSGIGTANAVFNAEHTNGTYTQIVTDENGKFTVRLKHDEQLEVFGLPAGTTATVVETEKGSGFTPAYWDNGVIGDGIVTIQAANTVSVIVVNDYAAAEVYPVDITVSGNKTLHGRENNEWLGTDNFTFELQRFDGLDTDTGTAIWTKMGEATANASSHSFNFTNAFANEKYEAAGTYYYRVIEIEPDTPTGGISYDKTVHSFSVVVGDANMDGKLEITSVAASRPDTTEVTATANGWNVNAKFTNTYSTSGNATVTIDLNKVITNNGGSAKSLAGYTFGLYDGETCVHTSPATTDRGFARFVLSYTETGTYQYTLKEIIPEPVPEGWTYSTLEIPVTVVVSDDGDGTISAIIYRGENQPANAGISIAATFTNSYDPADATLKIDFVEKQLTGRKFNEDDNFTFSITEINVAVGRTPQTLLGTLGEDADGDGIADVNFNGSLTFSEVGTYFFEVKETSADGNGVVTDKTTYRVTVTVTDVNGQLSASYTLINAVGNTITFKNTYTATSVEHSIKGTKELNGRTLVNDEFSFVLTEQSYNGTAIQNPRSWTVKNFAAAEDNIVFPAISYDKAGTYTYTVKEVIPDGGTAYGISYDRRTYTVTIVTEDNGVGALVVRSETVSGDGTTLMFENNYKANPTSAQFTGGKTLTGKVNNALLGGEFEFVLYNSDANWVQGSQREKVENGAGGIITFTKIDFDTDVDQYFIVKEVNGGEKIDGITYDDTIYRVWVEITDDLKGQLHATVHIYDGDGIPQSSISFVNIYKVTGTDTVELSGEKIIDGRDWKTGDTFTFGLFTADERFNYTANSENTVGSETVRYGDADHRFAFELTYGADDVGKTFYYVLIEDDSNPIRGLAYSNAVYKIKVEVKDDDEGGIETITTVENATISTLNFVNKYSITIGESVQFAATKGLSGKTIGDIKFSFDLMESNANWESVKVLQTKENSSTAITFDKIDYAAAGDYYYIIAEQNAGQTLSGITYDDSVYRIYVKVTDNLDGTLSKIVTIIKVDDGVETTVDTIAFVNSYCVTGTDTVELSGTKTFKGRDWTEDDAFTFEIYAADKNFENLGTAPVAATNADKATGKFALHLAFSADDIGSTFYYVLKEKNADQRIEGIAYSGTEYKVTVKVKDNGDGTVKAEATVAGAANNALNFTNTYTSDEVYVGFDGIKTLETKTGIRELKENDFTFDLYEANDQFETEGAAIQSKKNDENGSFSFDDIAFTEADTYYFVIKENSQNPIGGVVYDNAQYHITVEVTDNGKGKLEAKVSMLKVKDGVSEKTETITFVNEYNAAVANVTIGGSKILSGRDMADGEFKFLMIEADKTFTALEDADTMVALNADGKFSFDALSFTEVGTYYFIISEDTAVMAERISFDDAVYFVTIQVTDDENGKLAASDPVIVKKGSAGAVDTIEFTNVFVPKPTDITVDINIRKTVVNKGTDTTGPEDFEFLLKNLADSADGITVKSDKAGKAKFTLTFTEDDIGKTYSYKLSEVNSGRYGVVYSTAEYAITVAITLDEETNTLVAALTKNKSAAAELVAEFENIYNADVPDNPKTADNANLTMWMTLMFVSGGAAITLCASGKTKRRQEDV